MSWMDIRCIGVSHKTAPLAIREKLAVGPDRLADALQQLSAQARELMWISTCNRVEIYAIGAEEGFASAVRSWVAGHAGFEACSALYQLEEEPALIHLFRVASSLDSMVVGEPQILGQVKEAFELARKLGCAKGDLERACSAAFASAKRVRTETGIGRTATSMASAAVALATKVVGGLSDKSVLIVGAGEMGELAARHCEGAGSRVVVNRSPDRAQQLAAAIGASWGAFEELDRRLIECDVVICSAASPEPIFTKERVAASLPARRFRPLVMVDLAVPRDVAADVHGSFDGVYAYDVDDLQQIVSGGEALRQVEAAKAEVIVAEEVAKFVRARALRDGLPVLAQLRSRAEEIARFEAERSLSQWGEGLSERQKKGIEAMAMAIVNKLLHQPTAKLRAVDPGEDRDRLAGATAELFGLESAPISAGAKRR